MIEAIENSAYAVWVRESPSIFAYTTILSLHAIGLAIIVGIHTLIALRLLGFVPEIPLQPLRKLFPWMYLGFTINLFSGTSLLVANLSNDLGNWLFIAKLVFILFAMINLELTKIHVFDKPGPRCGRRVAEERTRLCDRGARALEPGDGRGAVHRLPELRRSVAWLLSGDEQWKRLSDFLDHAADRRLRRDARLGVAVLRDAALRRHVRAARHRRRRRSARFSASRRASPSSCSRSSFRSASSRSS